MRSSTIDKVPDSEACRPFDAREAVARRMRLGPVVGRRIACQAVGFEHGVDTWISGLLAVLLCFGLGCGGASALGSIETTPTEASEGDELREEFYVGEHVTTSPDGTVPYGPTVRTVVRRVYDTANQRVLEDFFGGGSLRRTTYELDFAASSCSVSDDRNGIRGTIHFTGDPFAWVSWTYNLKTSDEGGTITGEGKRSSVGYTTAQTFSLGGEPQVQVRATFWRVDQAEFDEALRALEATSTSDRP